MTAPGPAELDLVCAVIPSFNGRDLLEAHIPSLCAAIGEHRICVVDDSSSDDSVEMMRRSFPEANVVERTANGGFAAAVNDGIRATKQEFVVVINNDVEVTPGFLDPLLPIFDDDSVFAAAPRMLLPALGGVDDGAKTGAWHHGMFYAAHLADIRDARRVIFTSGGMSVYRRSMLEKLGGFDEAYSPFYWEDADLSYRAWKRGWRSVYQPRSEVLHRHSATISALPRAYVEKVKARNSLLFVWRNISDRGLVRRHRAWLPLVLAKRAVLGDAAFLNGWRDAYSRRREARLARAADDRWRRLSDREIMAEVGIRV